MSKDSPSKNSNEHIRLDKWLWAARFYKTRALSRSMIEGGKVHYNGKRTKPSKQVELGALVQLRQGYDEREVEVIALCEQRECAERAQRLYQETEKSLIAKAKTSEERAMDTDRSPRPERKPDKKQRRELMRFKQQ